MANFLLAWYNAADNGGWNPAELWAVDPQIADDIVTVIGLIRRVDCKYPNDLGFEQENWAIGRRWRGAAESAGADQAEADHIQTLCPAIDRPRQ